MKQYASLIFSMPVEVTCETKRGGGGRAAMLIGPGLNSEPYTMPTTSQLPEHVLRYSILQNAD